MSSVLLPFVVQISLLLAFPYQELRFYFFGSSKSVITSLFAFQLQNLMTNFSYCSLPYGFMYFIPSLLYFL